jgi:hypothetical protein
MYTRIISGTFFVIPAKASFVIPAKASFVIPAKGLPP